MTTPSAASSEDSTMLQQQIELLSHVVANQQQIVTGQRLLLETQEKQRDELRNLREATKTQLDRIEQKVDDTEAKTRTLVILACCREENERQEPPPRKLLQSAGEISVSDKDDELEEDPFAVVNEWDYSCNESLFTLEDGTIYTSALSAKENARMPQMDSLSVLEGSLSSAAEENKFLQGLFQDIHRKQQQVALAKQQDDQATIATDTDTEDESCTALVPQQANNNSLAGIQHLTERIQQLEGSLERLGKSLTTQTNQGEYPVARHRILLDSPWGDVEVTLLDPVVVRKGFSSRY